MNTNSQTTSGLPAKAGCYLHAGELEIAQGVGILIVSAALSHFVMIGILGLVMIPVAMGCWLTGIIRARNASAPAGRLVAGIMLMLAAAVVLQVTAFRSVGMAHASAVNALGIKSPAPGFGAWTLTAGSWFLPSLLLWPGLWLGANWPAQRRWIWCGAIFFVPILAIALFWILSGTLPITA